MKTAYVLESRLSTLPACYDSLIRGVQKAIDEISFPQDEDMLNRRLRDAGYASRIEKKKQRFRWGNSFIIGLQYPEMPYQALKAYPEPDTGEYSNVANLLGDLDGLEKLAEKNFVVKVNWTRLMKREADYYPWRYILYDFAVGKTLDQTRNGDELYREWMERLEKETDYVAWPGKNDLVLCEDGFVRLTDLAKLDFKD